MQTKGRAKNCRAISNIGTHIGSCRFGGQSAISHGRQCQLSPTIGNDSICRRVEYSMFAISPECPLSNGIWPELMDFGRTGHGDGERSRLSRDLSCCLRTPVINRCLSSGQKRDRADGSSRHKSIARCFFGYILCTQKVTDSFGYKR